MKMQKAFAEIAGLIKECQKISTLLREISWP